MKSLLEYVNNKRFADIIVLCNDELLLLQRAYYMKRFPGKWCLPGGHIDKSEDTLTTVLRELREETSISITNASLWKEWVFTNNESSDVYYTNLEDKPNVKISREHAKYKWIKIDEIVKYSEKFAGETYQLLKQFCETNFNKINES